MDIMNKARVLFLVFFSILLGIAIANGNTLGAVFDVFFIGLNLFQLNREYEEGTL